MEETPITDQRPELPRTLSLLRQKLSQKAKQEPKFRFYTLYGRIFQMETLLAAWNLAAANKGAAGIDGVTFADVANRDGGILRFLQELHDDLRSKRYYVRNRLVQHLGRRSQRASRPPEGTSYYRHLLDLGLLSM